MVRFFVLQERITNFSRGSQYHENQGSQSDGHAAGPPINSRAPYSSTHGGNFQRSGGLPSQQPLLVVISMVGTRSYLSANPGLFWRLFSTRVGMHLIDGPMHYPGVFHLLITVHLNP